MFAERKQWMKSPKKLFKFLLCHISFFLTNQSISVYINNYACLSVRVYVRQCASLSACIPISVKFLLVRIFISACVYQCVCLACVNQCVCLACVYQCVCSSVHMSINAYIYQCMCLSMCKFISVNVYISVNLSFSLALLSQVNDQTNICPKSLTIGESLPRIQTTVLSQKEGRGPIEAGVSLVEAWLEGVLLHHQDHHGKEEVGQAHDDNQRTFSFTLLAGEVEASKRDQDLVGKADGQQAPQHAQVDFGCGFRRKQRQVNLKKVSHC